MSGSASAPAVAPVLPVFDFDSSDPTDSDAGAGTASETTTLSGRYGSLTSPRSSLCSSSTDSVNISASAKSAKRVRFEESVCWSYFDINTDTARPALHRKPSSSFLGRSWQRFKSGNSSADDIASSSPSRPTLHRLKSQNFSVDMLEMDAKAARRLSAAPPNGYSIHQPLRQSAGRKFSGAETTAVCWKAAAPAQKGDWGDLLGSTAPQGRILA